jgi:DNA replicative helicase MCM subunit Mcm2 (Cdc46/Mcm family)
MFKSLFYWFKIEKNHYELRNIRININDVEKIKDIEKDKNFVDWINKKE